MCVSMRGMCCVNVYLRASVSTICSWILVAVSVNERENEFLLIDYPLGLSTTCSRGKRASAARIPDWQHHMLLQRKSEKVREWNNMETEKSKRKKKENKHTYTWLQCTLQNLTHTYTHQLCAFLWHCSHGKIRWARNSRWYLISPPGGPTA